MKCLEKIGKRGKAGNRKTLISDKEKRSSKKKKSGGGKGGRRNDRININSGRLRATHQGSPPPRLSLRRSLGDCGNPYRRYYSRLNVWIATPSFLVLAMTTSVFINSFGRNLAHIAQDSTGKWLTRAKDPECYKLRAPARNASRIASP
jgi:hypothetical protein